MAAGPGEILDLIRHGRVSTRGDIVEVTGLSRMTVMQRLDPLLEAGMVVEGDSGEATRGRRRRSLTFNPDHAQVLVCAVETTYSRIALTDLSGSVLSEVEIEVPVAAGPVDVLDGVGGAIKTLLRKHRGALDLCGAAISLPGPIDPVSARPSEPPIMPGWDGFPVSEQLSRILPGTPVHVANDADAAALGEYAAGREQVGSLCLVKVDTGIGTGIVVDGRIYPGSDGGAGDIGHVRVDPGSELRCQCGMTGCLAAEASGRAVARQLTELGIEARSGRDVGVLLREGNVEAARLTQEAGRRIGEVMATVVCLLNPEVVLVGGALVSAALLAGIRETLYSRALPRATRRMELQVGSLGDRAALAGLTRLVVDREYSPAAINRSLRAAP